jgi:hypothetical protein
VQQSTFDVFVDWLYTAKLPTNRSSTRAMMEAIFFGHVYLVPTFQEAVHNELVDVLAGGRNAVGYADVAFMFKHLPADNALLALFVVLHCYYGDKVMGEAEMQVHGKELAEYWRRIKAEGFKTVDLLDREPVKACEYHVHATEEERWGCGAD